MELLDEIALQDLVCNSEEIGSLSLVENVPLYIRSIRHTHLYLLSFAYLPHLVYSRE